MSNRALFAGTCCIAAIFAMAADDAGSRRVLVLSNEETLTGYISLRDGQYHLQGPNSETVIPAARVAKVCESLEDACEYLCSRANLKDADERLRLARWCQRNGLTARAREQAEAALRLRPGDGEAQTLLRALAAQAAVPAASPAPARRMRPAPAAPNSQEQDFKPETLVEYTRQIQPIVMNGCGLGSCHGNNRGNGYELYRAPVGSQLTALQTRQNLVRTLALVDREDVEQSPLLQKALQPHGGGNKPPLGGSDSPAYRNLLAWVNKLGTAKAPEAASDSNNGVATAPAAPGGGASGFASERDDQPAKPLPRGEPRITPREQRPKAETSASATGAKTGDFAAGAAEALPETGPATPPASKPPITGDPFDPEIFNRQFHKK